MEPEERPNEQHEEPTQASPSTGPITQGDEQRPSNTDIPGPKPAEQPPQGSGSKANLEKRTCWATIVIAAATGVYAVLAGLQWYTMRHTLTQMKTDSASTSEGMKKQLDAMEKQATAMSGQFGEMCQQSKQMRDATHLEQRAWVGCSGIECKELAVGKMFTIKFGYSNTGRTPANALRIRYDLHWDSNDHCDMERIARTNKERTETEDASGGAIAPGHGRNRPIDVNMHNLTDVIVQEVKERRRFLYFFGEITYDDVFEEEHTTRFCFLLDPSGWKMKAYPQYDRME
ncbi:MAG: hypothetical protein ABFD90_17050 [Phycisphaerales bacterium]